VRNALALSAAACRPLPTSRLSRSAGGCLCPTFEYSEYVLLTGPYQSFAWMARKTSSHSVVNTLHEACRNCLIIVLPSPLNGYVVQIALIASAETEQSSRTYFVYTTFLRSQRSPRGRPLLSPLELLKDSLIPRLPGAVSLSGALPVACGSSLPLPSTESACRSALHPDQTPRGQGVLTES